MLRRMTAIGIQARPRVDLAIAVSGVLD